MKRISNTELNHENWNDEEAPEERGKFTAANVDVISKRKVITAKRKPAISQAGIFKALGKFTSNATPSNDDNKEKHLNNLKMLNKTFVEKCENFINENSCCILSPLFEDYKRHLATIKTKYPLSSSDVNVSVLTTNPSESNNSSIKGQSSASSFNFIPTISVFGNNASVSDNTNSKSSPFSIPDNAVKLQDSEEVAPSILPFFMKASKNQENDEGMHKSTFAFGVKSQESSIFGTTIVDAKKPASATPFPLFGSGISTESKPALVTNLFGGCLFPIKATDTANTNNDDEEYVPPKAETREVKESDSVFDIRCKLFYQVDQAWKEKGVGNIFIKPLSEGKCQLVMRADNTLGTILLNVLVNKSMPLSVTKNNVSLVAITDFVKSETKPTPLLLRVKTAGDAETLLAAIKKQVG